MVEFLSDAWVDRLDAAARGAGDLVTDTPLVVATLVLSAGSESGYHVRFGPDGASVGRPGADRADVALVTDPVTAWALHEGTIRAQDAFARGRLKVRGRPELLATHAALLAALERVLAPVRAATTPPPLLPEPPAEPAPDDR